MVRDRAGDPAFRPPRVPVAMLPQASSLATPAMVSPEEPGSACPPSCADGTVQEEKIYHMAGARTPEMITTREIEAVIRAAGRSPVERDTLYNVIQ